MFKIVQRFSSCAWTGEQPRLIIQRLQNYATLQMRDILIEQYAETGTLFVKFAKYIAIQRYNNMEPVKTTIKYASYFPISDNRYFRKELEKTPANQIAALLIFASTYRTNAQPEKLLDMINDLDRVAVKQLEKLKVEEILNTLYALLYFAPYWLTRMDLYRFSLETLIRSFQGNESVETFVQLCFYLGLQKKRAIIQANEFKDLLDKYLDKYLPRLNLMDLGIISNASYKTSTLIDSKLYNEYLENAVVSFKFEGGNEGLFITFLKAMRFQRVHSKSVCERLTNFSQNPEELKLLQAASLAHLFVYLAENLWDSPIAIEALKGIFFKKLRENPIETRAKDVAMFAWCCAQLNICLSKDELIFLEESLLEKVNNGQFKYFPDQLVDSCLSLWALGQRSEKLLISAIRQKASLKQKSRHQPKVDNRLTLLMTACAIESPKWIETYINVNEAFDKNFKVPPYILKQYTELYGLMESLSSNDSIKSVKMVMPLNGINIPNLIINDVSSHNKNEINSVRNSKVIFIEYLKPEQILQFSKEPVLIIRLKKRLLEFFGYKVIFVQSQDLQDNCSILKKYLIPETNELGDNNKVVLSN